MSPEWRAAITMTAANSNRTPTTPSTMQRHSLPAIVHTSPTALSLQPFLVLPPDPPHLKPLSLVPCAAGHREFHQAAEAEAATRSQAQDEGSSDSCTREGGARQERGVDPCLTY